jgi:PAS domain S-box-containing protein
VDEAPVRLGEGAGNQDSYDSTQSINFDGLFKEALSSSGSFDIRGEIWATTFGKVLQALPIAALLVDPSYDVFAANEACGKLAPDYKSMLGAPFRRLADDQSGADRLDAVIQSVFNDRKSRLVEGAFRIGKARIWGRVTFRAIRVLCERFALVLVEDLTNERRRFQENLKLRQELEIRVRDRTALLAEANERLEREIERRAKFEKALSREKARFEILSTYAPFALCAINAEGAFTYVNPRFTDLTGYVLTDAPNASSLFGGVGSMSADASPGGEFPPGFQMGSEHEGRIGRVIELRRKDGGLRKAHVRWRTLHDGRRLVTVEDITERVAADEALRISEERFRTLFETSLDAIAVVSSNGRFLEFNGAFCDLVGYGREEIESLNFTDVWDDVEELRRLKRTVDREGAVGQQECVFRVKGGAKRHCVMSATVRREGATPVAYQLIVRDVTQQKLDQEALRESEEQYRNIYTNAVVGLLRARIPDGKILKANETAATKILGYPDTKTLLEQGVSVADFYSPEYRAAFSAELMKSGEVTDFEMHFVRHDGSELDVSVWARLYPEKEYIEAAVIDISKRKRAERALAASEEKHRKILETIADGYHEVDLKGNLLIFNDSLCEILGYPRDELVGKTYRDLLDEEQASRVSEAYNKVFRTGTPLPSLEYQVVRKDGEKRDASVSIALIRDALGRAVGFRGIMRDITAQKRMEDQLRQAAKMEAIGRLAGGIAHDFNNLMTAINGYSELLLKEEGHSRSIREKVEHIQRAGRRAEALTKQLLAFGRKQVLNVRVIDLNVTVRETMLMLERLIGEDIELVAKSTEGVAAVEADPVQIAQLIMNLLVNARDAMPGGGRLTVETSLATLDETYVSDLPDLKPGSYVTLSVSDTGPGMDEETKKHIFEPFFTTKKLGEGTGLGLSTAYGIVKQHGGHITVHSETGCGSAFKVFLPRSDKPIDGAAPPKPKTSVLRGAETVLVVEDEQVVLDLVCQVLEMCGYAPLPASDPEEALRICAEYPGTIQLMVTDVVLPRMDGRTLYEKIAPMKPDMRVLYVSGHTENFIVHRGILDPGIHFLQKPFSADRLAEKIREVLDDGR